MSHRTILKFTNEEDVFEVVDNNGRPVDPIDLSETLEAVNNEIGFELYKTDVNDRNVDGEDLTVVSVNENDSGAVTEEIIVGGDNSFNAALAEKGWFMEEADSSLLDEFEDEELEDDEDFEGIGDDDDDEDYQSGPEDFED